MTIATSTLKLATTHTQGFVADAVADARTAGVAYSAEELFHVTSRFAAWCALRGVALERSSAFREDVIGEFILNGFPTLSDASRGNKRAQLRRMAEVFRPEIAPVEALAPADPKAPYLTAKDLSRLRMWASAQPDSRRSDAWCILALGLGAGLSAAEIGGVLVEDILIEADGVQVRVRDGRKRTVPVRAAWTDELVLRAKQDVPGDYLVRPARKNGTPRNFISNFVRNGKKSEAGPDSQRMRSTWLVSRLDANVPVKALLKAAGLDSLEALTRYLPFVGDAADATARAALAA